MIPLLLCSVLAVAIGLERIWYYAKTRSDTEDLMEEVRASLDEGRPLEAIHFLKKQRGPVASVLAAGLAFSDRSPSEIRERIARSARKRWRSSSDAFPLWTRSSRLAPVGHLGHGHGDHQQFSGTFRARRSHVTAGLERRYRRSADHDRHGSDHRDSVARPLQLAVQYRRPAYPRDEPLFRRVDRSTYPKGRGLDR